MAAALAIQAPAVGLVLLDHRSDLHRPTTVGSSGLLISLPKKNGTHWSPFRGWNRIGVILYNLVFKMYNSSMAKVTMSEGRERLSEMVDIARSEAVVFERYGRPAAVMISADRYEEMMEALEEIEDISAFDAAMSEEGANIPWEQVKRDLGWT